MKKTAVSVLLTSYLLVMLLPAALTAEIIETPEMLLENILQVEESSEGHPRYDIFPTENFVELAESTTSGTCGDNLTWILDSSGALTISGTGNFNSEQFRGLPSIKSVIINNGITGIGDHAFDTCYELTNVTLPSSLTVIGNYAFFACSKLSHIEIPNGVTSIGDYAFYNGNKVNGHIGLTSVIIPDSVTAIGNYAFGSCEGLKSVTIPNSVTTIGDSAFRGCIGLTNISIPSTIATIGASVFESCKGLTNVIIQEGFTTIGESMFNNCKALSSVIIPESIISIGNSAFKDCSELTDISIPSHVFSIGDFAFYNCNKLVDIIIPNSVNTIGKSAFAKCSGLTNISISNSVTYIGAQAFYGCSGLTDLVVPNSVTVVGSDAFVGCSALISVTFPAGVDIGVFGGCKALTYIRLTGNGEMYDSYNWNWTPWRQSSYHGNKITIDIESGVTSIGKGAFRGCDAIMKVDIPNTVVTIGDSAFYGCSGLTDITIPDSVVNIGNSAFRNCSGFTKVTIPNSIASVGSSAFSGCNGLTSITMPATTNVESDAFSDCTSIAYVRLTGTGEMGSYRSKPWGSNTSKIDIDNGVTSITNSAFSGCSGLTTMTIPNSITSIGNSAFYGCSGLTDITIPDSVVNIGNSAFRNCSGFTKVTIPNSVASVGSSAFSGCNGLTSITMPATTNVESDAFSDCTSIAYVRLTGTGEMGTYSSKPWGINTTKIDIESGVTSIGSSAFSGCSGLTSMIIPNSVTSIGNSAFSGCSGLTSMIIPNSVISIGNSAFSGCRSLTNVAISNSVTSISNSVFSGCSSLTSVTVPRNVTSIGRAAFGNCSALTGIAIPSSVTDIGPEAFYGCTALTDVYYGGTASQWKSITIGSYNTPLTAKTTTIHYNSAEWNSINLTLRSGSDIMTVGKQDFILAEISNARGLSADDIIWASSDPNVVAITQSSLEPSLITGNITAVAAIEGISVGTATITITLPNGRAASIDITVGNTLSSSDCRIVPMDFGSLEINGSGTATAWFRVTDLKGTPLPGQILQYKLNGINTTPTVVADGNGLVGITTPRIERSGDFVVVFLGIGNAKVWDNEQLFHVTVKKVSYTQEWSEKHKFGVDISAGPSASASVGVAEAEASAVKAALSTKFAGSLSISDEHNGENRTVELKYANSGDIGLQLKSGIEAGSVSKAKIKIIGANGKVSAATQNEAGLKIKNYDPSNDRHALQVGTFILAGQYAASMSMLRDRMFGILDPSICNMYANQNSVALSAGANFGKVELAGYEGALAGTNGTVVWSFKDGADYEDELRSITKTFKASSGSGIGASVDINDDSKDVPKHNGNLGAYIWGKTNSNNKEIKAVYDLLGTTIKSFSYRTYLGDESDIFWAKESSDTYATVSFNGANAEELLRRNDELSNFARGKNPFIDMQKAISYMGSSGITANVKETTKVKQGFDADVPIGVEFGIGAKLGAGLSGERSVSYDSRRAVLYQNNSYVVSESDVTQAQVGEQTISIFDFLKEPVAKSLEACAKGSSVILGPIANGVINTCASVKGTASSWFASVVTVPSAQPQSYGVFSLMSDTDPISNAAISATLGDPYLITIYTDESQSECVSDEQLRENPLTLTLDYSDEMLRMIGANLDADIMILRFDEEKNLYICENDCIQDKGAKTVTTEITRNGEYVLAVDSIAPIVTDFRLEDSSTTPTISALISDLSGISSFRFWIDDGNDLIATDNLSDCYDEKTGIFTYSFASPLASGAHVAYFLAADSLGNANPEAIAFPFTVYSIEGTVSITKISDTVITEARPFKVEAICSPNTAFNSVSLQCSADGVQLINIPMTLSDGIWIAEVVPVVGADQMQLTAVATDDWGNMVSSEIAAVSVNLTGVVDGVQIQNASYVNGGVRITAKSTQGGVTSGILLAAAYQDGQQIVVGSTGIGLSADTLQTVFIQLPEVRNATEVKIFFISPSNYTPQCATYTFPM